MTIIIAVWVFIILAFAALALALPCEGCRLRRERLRQAYARWRETHPTNLN